MFTLTNKNTNIDLTDVYGHVIEFHYECTAKTYYANHCQGMCNVIIKQSDPNICDCEIPLVHIEVENSICMRCDKVVKFKEIV